MTPASSATPLLQRPALGAAIAATVLLGLLADCYGGPWAGQLLASVWVWLLFVWMAARVPALERAMLLRCLAIATIGECVMALAWGLYDYRLGNVPAFVPPGHVLMLVLGMQLARPLSSRAAARLAWTAWWAMLAAVPLLGDWLSLPLLLLFAVLWRACPGQRPVFAVMLLLALALELLGTALGSWTWRPVVPWLGLPSGNPPLGASVMYCVLDWLVLRSRRFTGRIWPSRSPASYATR